jgi:Ca2+/Na+ antiporter
MGHAAQPAFFRANSEGDRVFRRRKAWYGSTLFTLTLPVSRFRLVAVRASLGWLEMAGGIGWICCLLWRLFPVIRGRTTPHEMVEYAAVLIVCGSAFYCITVLLAAFLDDLWRVWASLICYGAGWWLAYEIPAPASVDIFLAMGDGSPVLAHTMPWTAMAFALGLAAVLFFAALKIVQIREY